ncbi:GH3 domain-containing protein-like [Diadema antillarum]|uniref:GH3 domain-containing protein-like n=1 Tax=Diadema antillarum TaxID=105358 RepID=UPI003A8B6F0A
MLSVLFRTGQMLNLRFEKLDQTVVLESVRAAVNRWPGRCMLEFAVAESTILTKDCPVVEPDELAPYYLFFIELQEAGKSLSDTEKQAIDEELRLRNSDYERLRREVSISHPRVFVVRPGTFDVLKDYLLENTGATANQYKVPRKLRTYVMVDTLLKGMV